MKINLHSHTQFCDGRSSMEEILEAARKEGFSTWGFSPHAPICLESPCNMKAEDVGSYLKEIERLKVFFPDIKILAGMEVDYIDDNNGPSCSQVQDYGLDYVIGSIHFIPNQKGEFYDIDGSPERFQRILKEYFNGDLNYVVKTFWVQTQRMIKAGGLDIVGHIDKISLNASFVNPDIENDPRYKRLAQETISMAMEKGLQIEINTKHYEKYGKFFPHPRYWKQILKEGHGMPINSDAHYADRIESGISQAETIMNEIKSDLC